MRLSGMMTVAHQSWGPAGAASRASDCSCRSLRWIARCGTRATGIIGSTAGAGGNLTQGSSSPRTPAAFARRSRIRCEWWCNAIALNIVASTVKMMKRPAFYLQFALVALLAVVAASCSRGGDKSGPAMGGDPVKEVNLVAKTSIADPVLSIDVQGDFVGPDRDAFASHVV